MKKIIWPGIIIGIVMLVLGLLVNYLFMLFPAVTADYQNTNVMRSWQDPLMMLFFLHPFVVGIILAWVWDRSKGLFHGSAARKGTQFGLAIWLIATVPGMLISYGSFTLSLLTIISWTVSGLINDIVAGIILSRINN